MPIVSLTMMMNAHANASELIIDDRNNPSLESTLEINWRLVSDQVMGGVSTGSLKADQHAGKNCLRMTGQVSTENNGGFVQMALDITAQDRLDVTRFDGIQLEVAGNNETYNLHLRTTQLWLPWQSYRASFETSPQWRIITIPFDQLTPYRTGRTFRKDSIKRIGLVAIGRDFSADLCLGKIMFYSNLSDSKQ